MRRENGSPKYSYYNFRQPWPEAWRDISRSVLGLISATQAFQRLKKIRFLGAIDYALIDHPNYKKGNVRHSRFHHSRGVARLAIDYAAKTELEEREGLTLIAAALLHDVGHCPFSHSLEPIFRQYLGIDHHDATKGIITGKLAIGREMYGVLRDQLIDIERVLALISGEDKSFHGLFSGPINFDTVEGVFRSFSYVASGSIPNPHHVIDATVQRLNNRDQQIVDQFWSYKDRIYTSIINSKIGILSDYVCQALVLQHVKKLDVIDYFSSDFAILRRIPKLRIALANLQRLDPIDILSTDTISFHTRRFYIDTSSDFYLRDDEKRYKQLKQPQILKLSNESASVSTSFQDSLDDHIQRQLDLFE